MLIDIQFLLKGAGTPINRYIIAYIYNIVNKKIKGDDILAVTIQSDKIAIVAILSTDDYITEYLKFDPMEIYKVKANDNLLREDVFQIFVYNTYPEPTINPAIYGVVYEVDVSVPWKNSGTADLAIEQIIALLHDTELTNGVKLEIIDMPTVLSSETSLYQVGVRFVSYQSIYNKPKVKPKIEIEPDDDEEETP